MQMRSRLILALLVFIITTGFYFFWPQYFYVGDDLQAAMAIEQGVTGHYYYHPAGGRLYDPSQPTYDPDKTIELNTRYYLEYPISVLVGRIWHALGWNGDVITPILTFRALVGGLGALFLYLAICETGSDSRVAALISLGFGFSAAYWSYSTRIYQSINMISALALGFYLLLRLGKSSSGIGWRGKTALAIVLWIASLTNITAILSFFPFGVAIALVHPDKKITAKIGEFVRFSVVSGIIGVLIIVFIITNSAAPRSVNPLVWQDAPVAGDSVFGVSPLRDTFRTILGFARSIVVLPNGPNSLSSVQMYWDSIDTGERIWLLAFYSVVLSLCAIPVVVMLFRWRRMQNYWLWITLAIWFVTYTVFNWFWDPGSVKYWLIPLMCWWVVLALTLNHLKDTRWHLISLNISVVFVIFVFAINFSFQFLPESRRDNDPLLADAEIFKAVSNSNDLLVTDRTDLSFYISYFSDRNVISVSLIIEASGSVDAAQAIVKDHLERHQSDGGQIYVHASSSANLPLLAQVVGVTNEKQLEVTRQSPGLTIYRAIYQ
jgi:hypothetical protein